MEVIYKLAGNTKKQLNNLLKSSYDPQFFACDTTAPSCVA